MTVNGGVEKIVSPVSSNRISSDEDDTCVDATPHPHKAKKKYIKLSRL